MTNHLWGGWIWRIVHGIFSSSNVFTWNWSLWNVQLHKQMNIKHFRQLKNKYNFLKLKKNHLRISRADQNLKSLRSYSGCTSYWSWKEKLLRRAWPIAKSRMDPFRFLGQHTIAWRRRAHWPYSGPFPLHWYLPNASRYRNLSRGGSTRRVQTSFFSICHGEHLRARWAATSGNAQYQTIRRMHDHTWYCWCDWRRLLKIFR